MFHAKCMTLERIYLFTMQQEKAMAPLRGKLVGTLLAVSALVGMGTPRAAEAQLSFWEFVGNCEDCARAAEERTYQVGRLVLNNYVQGQMLTNNNFVSFTYEGSNLLDSFLVYTGLPPEAPVEPWVHALNLEGDGLQGSLISGGAQTLSMFFGDGLELTLADGQFFICGAKGDTYYAVACSWQQNQDFGTGSFIAQNVSTVPEPSTYALMAAGLGALLAFRRRRQAA